MDRVPVTRELIEYLLKVDSQRSEWTDARWVLTTCAKCGNPDALRSAHSHNNLTKWLCVTCGHFEVQS